MGMRGHIRQITPNELRDFQHNPKKLQSALRPPRKNMAKIMETLDRLQKVAAEARAMNLNPAEQEKIRAGMLQELAAVGGGFQVGPYENGINLEKSWHVLHYLLTGKAEDAPPPLGNAILGGKEIGPDLGYGPARFLTPAQVREVADVLKIISKDDLARRFNLDAMIAANIYPVGSGGEDELELAQDYFDQVSRYYSEAARNDNAMLLFIV